MLGVCNTPRGRVPLNRRDRRGAIENQLDAVKAGLPPSVDRQS